MMKEKTKNANIRAATTEVSFSLHNLTGLKTYPILKQQLRSCFFRLFCIRQIQ